MYYVNKKKVTRNESAFQMGSILSRIQIKSSITSIKKRQGINEEYNGKYAFIDYDND